MTLTRNQLETLIVQRAWGDEAFRSEFLSDPKATIEKYGEQKLPAEVKVFAHAEDDTTVHFVIPQKPLNADELSDEDLEKVAGGVDLLLLGIAASTAVATAMGAAAVTKGHGGW